MELKPVHPYTLRVYGFETLGLDKQAFEAALQSVLRLAGLSNIGEYKFKLVEMYSSHPGRMFEFRHKTDECLYTYRCYVGGVCGIPVTHYGVLYTPPKAFRAGIFDDLKRAAAEVLSQLPPCESSGESPAKAPDPEEQPPAPQRAAASSTDSSPVADPPPQPAIPMKEKKVKRPTKKTVAAVKRRITKRKPTLEQMLKQAHKIESALAKQLEETRGMVASIETLIEKRDKLLC